MKLWGVSWSVSGCHSVDQLDVSTWHRVILSIRVVVCVMVGMGIPRLLSFGARWQHMDNLCGGMGSPFGCYCQHQAVEQLVSCAIRVYVYAFCVSYMLPSPMGQCI